ncbi:MAG: hypothetical protein JRI93_10645 [Deltaproteobacteria bacterium]|nr:hypothetical protein [Deltaproteobacteria bacterium]MBW2634574.1 hypothetical protein [Deltaproteobacteria bacterium]
MNSKQLAVLVIVAFGGGVVGGFVSDRVGSIGQAFARGPQMLEKIEAKVVEASEFRIVDDNGRTLARFYHHEYSKLAIASLEFIESGVGQRNKLQLLLLQQS